MKKKKMECEIRQDVKVLLFFFLSFFFEKKFSRNNFLMFLGFFSFFNKNKTKKSSTDRIFVR